MGMNSESKKAFKAGSWSIICTFITGTLNFITTPVFTRLLDPEEYGVVNTYNAWFGILSIVFTLQLQGSISKACIDLKRDTINDYILSMAGLVSFSNIACFCVAFLLQTTGILSQKYLLIYYIIAVSWGTAMLNLYLTVERFWYHYRVPMILTVLNAFLNISISLIFVYLYPSHKAFARIIGSGIGTIIIGMGIFAAFLKKGDRIICFEYWKYGLYYAVPLIFHVIGLQILSQADRIMIQNICGDYETGIYSVPYNLCKIITALWGSVLMVLNPWLYRKIEEKNYRDVRDNIEFLFQIVFIGVITVVAGAPLIMKIMAPSEYFAGVHLIAPIVVGLYFSCIYTVFCTYEQAKRKVLYTPIGTLIATIINIFLNWICIKKCGYTAAAYTTLVCYILLAVFHAIICVKNNGSQVYRYNKLFLYGFIALGISYILQMLYSHIICRYLCWLIIVFLFVSLNKNIFNFVRRIFDAFKKSNKASR